MSDISVRATSTTLMSRAAFEKLTIEELIEYLISQGVSLDDKKQSIFRVQEIDGEALTYLSQEALERHGILAGPAAKILGNVPKK